MENVLEKLGMPRDGKNAAKVLFAHQQVSTKKS